MIIKCHFSLFFYFEGNHSESAVHFMWTPLQFRYSSKWTFCRSSPFVFFEFWKAWGWVNDDTIFIFLCVNFSFLIFPSQSCVSSHSARDFKEHRSSLSLSCSPSISERLSWECVTQASHTSDERANRWANTLITAPALLRLHVCECFSVPHDLLRKHYKHYIYLFSVLLLNDLES